MARNKSNNLCLNDIDTSAASLSSGIRSKQFSGAPSNYTVGTTDATVFTLAAGEIGFIQNLDDAGLAVKKGASASPTSLSFVLPPCAVAGDGSGGAVKIDDWIGVVSVAAMSGTASYIAYKYS